MHVFDETLLKKNLGKLIATKRKALKLSQEALAEILEIKTRTLSKIENGHTFISAKTLCKLCETFNSTPRSFFDFYGEPNDKNVKLNEITDKLTIISAEKLDIYYELLNLIDRKL